MPGTWTAGCKGVSWFMQCKKRICEALVEQSRVHRNHRNHFDVYRFDCVYGLSNCSPGTANAETDLPDFFADPRFGGMGHRAIVPVSEVSESDATGKLSDYHFWRVCCAIPEGPRDLKIDEVMPLHANLDLLDFISFSKGCYVGQELLTRTKHRGAVRRRIFTVIGADGDDGELKEKLQEMKRTDPLSHKFVMPIKESLQPEGEKDVAIFGQTDGEPKQVGTLLTTSQNLALCLLRCEGAFNEIANFERAPLPENMKVMSSSNALHFVVRAPPYVFS